MSPLQVVTAVAKRIDAQNRADQYRALASFFLDLPKRETLQIMAEAVKGDPDASEGLRELQVFFSEASIDDEGVLDEVGSDRTFLVRGVTQKGPRPPYGSLFAGETPEAPGSSMLRLKALYRRAGFEVSESAAESPDYLGVELAFAAALLDKVAVAEGEEAEKLAKMSEEFVRGFVAPFGHAYVQESLGWARTGFCRGMLLLLREFLESEIEFVGA